MRGLALLTEHEQERLQGIRMRLERDMASLGDDFVGYWETTFLMDIIDRQRARISELERTMK